MGTYDVTINGEAKFDLDLDYSDIYQNIEHSIEYLVEGMLDDHTPNVDVGDEVHELLDEYRRSPNPCGVGESFEGAVLKAVQRNAGVVTSYVEDAGLTAEPDYDEIRKFVRNEVRTAFRVVLSEAARLTIAE